jgi:hypothetical protein
LRYAELATGTFPEAAIFMAVEWPVGVIMRLRRMLGAAVIVSSRCVTCACHHLAGASFMDGNCEGVERGSPGCKTGQTGKQPSTACGVDLSCQDKVSQHKGVAPVQTGHLWCAAAVNLAAVAWVVGAVLFYMMRFAVSVWEAGARGIYGL